MTIPSLTNEPSATTLAADIATGKLSAVEATEAAIIRIENLDGPINAVVVRDFERAMQAARDADARLATFPGLPSTVLPIGAVGGLPIGLQVIADRFNDHTTIDAARQIAELLSK